MNKENLLQLKNATIRFGETVALRNATIKVHGGEIVVIIGPNGAGKSTLLKALMGLERLKTGAVFIRGARVRPKPYRMVESGVIYIPQEHNVFLHLSVVENLSVGISHTLNSQAVQEQMSEVFNIFPALAQKKFDRANTLSGGQRQMLAVARGLMYRPSVLLLDEPSAGLAPNLVSSMFKSIKEINQRHATAIVIVEHNVSSALSIADRVYIVEKAKIAESKQSKAQLKVAALRSLLG